LKLIEEPSLKVLVYCRSFAVGAGYDLSNGVPFRLMQGRLGVYDKQPYDKDKNTIAGIAE
jgi:hypothetical protein